MPDSAFPHQIVMLERRQERQHDWLSKIDDGAVVQAVTIARHEERLDGHDEALHRLADSINKGVWALIGFSFTVAASAVGLAITIGGAP